MTGGVRPISLEPVVLEGDFVRLEPMTLEHHSGLSEVGLDPEIWRLTTVMIRTPEEMRSYMESALSLQREGTTLPFATIERSSGRIVGSTRFGNYDPANRRIEIGWTWLERSHWGTGANIETKYLLLRNAFEKWGAMRVEFKTDARNLRVRGALLGIGASFEGIFRKHMVLPDSIRDSAWYAIVDDDWPAVKALLERKIQQHAGASRR